MSGRVEGQENLPTIWKPYVLFPKAIETSSPLPALKLMGQVCPTTTGAVKVVLLNVIAWPSAEAAKAPRSMNEYIV